LIEHCSKFEELLQTNETQSGTNILTSNVDNV